MQRLDTIFKKRSMFTRICAVALAVSAAMSVFELRVSARNTYVITDGDRVTVHTTYATDPTDVLTEAGVVLGETDIFETTPTDDGHEITILRSMEITVDNCGVVTTVLSYGETVRELLERGGITYSRGATISADLDAQVTADMKIIITDTLVSQDGYTLSIPFETEYQSTDLLDKGVEVVLTHGVNGEKFCQAQVTYVNGKETGRVILSEEITTEPVKQVVAVGTGKTNGKNKKPIIGDGVIITPEGDVLTYKDMDIFRATAYTHTDPGCGFYTATGTRVHVGSVAVDPTVIPYGTRMFIVTKDGRYIYGVATAEDCGGSIKQNRIDLYFPTYDECIQFGVRNCYVYFLG